MIETIDQVSEIEADAMQPIDGRRLLALKRKLAEQPDVDNEELAAAMLAVEVELYAEQILGDGMDGVLTDGQDDSDADDFDLGGESGLRLLRE